MATIRGEPPLATKLHVPPPPQPLVRRARLVERLQRAITRPLTLMAAPAGFGKTTLLSAWLADTQLPAAWIALESDDNDLARFWSYVFMACARIQPGSGASATALLRAASLGPPPPIEAVLSVWINEWAARPAEMVLVLDDYHLITAPAIHQALAFLVDHLPPGLRLILATRADPPLPLARLRARGQLTEIRAADLRFSGPEAAEFLTAALGPRLSVEAVAALEARTEGWIAGLQLAALSLQGRDDIPAFVEAFTGSHRYIIDYLVEEVLAHQTERVQNFLLQTSILDQLQGALCEAVLNLPAGESGGQAMLEQLERGNLFLTAVDDERQWYRYHQLFAEALRHRLKLRQPDRAPELHRRASRWYEQHGRLRDAVQHALAAGDFELAAPLMEQAGNSLIRQGEIATLQRWVDALPGELVRARIEIAIWQGWLLFVNGQYAAAEQHLADLERRFGFDPATKQPASQPAASEASRPAEILGRISAIRASIAIIQRDLPSAVAQSRQALENLPPENMARAYVAWYLGKAHWLGGDLPAASAALADALRVSWEVDHRYAAFLVANDLAQLQITQGRLHQADQTYRQALARALERGSPQPALGAAYVGRAQLEREWNHLDAAAALLRDGLQFCRQTGNAQAILQAYLGLAFVHQDRGEAGSANAMLQQALDLAGRQPAPQAGGALVEACRAWLALRQGDEAAADRWAQRCGLAVDQELNHTREREYLTLARVLIRQGRLGEAQTWLTQLLSLAETQGRQGSVIEIGLLQAEACQAAGDGQQAVARLGQVLVLAEPEGYVRLFVDEGAPMARLLAQLRAGQDGGLRVSTDYREQLLALLGGGADGDGPRAAGTVPQSGAAPLPEALSERELDVLRLIVAGSSNQEIADGLVIALSTVKWYINVIYGKLQVTSRTKAIARARALNIA